MDNVMTTRLSSKGQIVLPEALRTEFGWGVGTAFTVMTCKGAVIMRPIKPPTEDELLAEFDEAFEESRRQARTAGMKLSDISRAVRDVRTARRTRR